MLWHCIARWNVSFDEATMRVLGRLTVTKVKNARPADGSKTLSLCDGGGLWLQVGIGKHGQINRSWYFRYAAPGTRVSRSGREYRRERVVGLGPVHTVGLAEAREAARECRVLLRAGKDPLDEKNARAASAGAGRAIVRTFERAAFEYLAKFEDSWKNARHRRQWRETLRDYMLPTLGRLDVEAIATDDVLRVLEPIWGTIPETASRVRGRIETVLDFAGCNASNPARWKGHLEHRLAKRNKARTVQHLPALPYSEMPSFMAELRAVDSIQAKALEFCILTHGTKSTWTAACGRYRQPGRSGTGSMSFLFPMRRWQYSGSWRRSARTSAYFRSTGTQ
jgi:hypothetical protein